MMIAFFETVMKCSWSELSEQLWKWSSCVHLVFI